MAGQRHNIGLKYGLLSAQLALALDGVDREKILTQIIDFLAQRGYFEMPLTNITSADPAVRNPRSPPRAAG